MGRKHFLILVMIVALVFCRNPLEPPICYRAMRAIYDEKVAAGVYADTSSFSFMVNQNPWVFEHESVYFSVDQKTSLCVVERRATELTP